MDKWLQKFIPNTPIPATDNVDTLATASRLSVHDMPIFEKLLSNLSKTERDFYEERAAIMEFDGKMPRQEAERLAYENTIKLIIEGANYYDK